MITVYADDTVITVINDEPLITILPVETSAIEVGARGPQGPRGLPGNPAGFVNGSAHVEFEWNSISTLPISTITGDKVIIKVAIIITEAFNGTSPTLRLGDSGNLSRLIGSNDNDPRSVSEYSVSPQVSYVTDTPIVLTINPGAAASQGKGLVIVEVQN